MRYVMKQKIFSWGDSFSIKDENENDAFYVKGEVFSFGHKLSFQNAKGDELLYIKQRLMSWSPTYEFYKGEQLYGSLKKEVFSFFKCRFEIETDAGIIEVLGDFLDHEYEFARGGRIIARVSKEWFSWSDTYGIEIADEENEVFILACAVAIDLICHDGDK